MMTVSTTTPYIQHTASGSTATFSYPFRVLEASHINAYWDSSLQNSGRYTVTGVGNANGGTVVFTTNPPAGVKVTLRRLVPTGRTDDYQDGAAIFESALDGDQDLQTMQQQQISTDVAASLRVPFLSLAGGFNPALSTPIANSYIAINATATGVSQVAGPVPSSWNLPAPVDNKAIGWVAGNLVNIGLSELEFVQSGSALNTRSGQAKMRDYRTVADHSSLQAAITSEQGDGGGAVNLTANYPITAKVTLPDTVSLYGDGVSTYTVPDNTVAFECTSVTGATYRDLVFTGSATTTSSVPSMAFNTQLAGANTADDLSFYNISASGMTLGLNLTKTNRAAVIGGKYGGMVYSPVTLGSSGGYGVLLQGANQTRIIGAEFKAAADDRHAVYASRVSTDPVDTYNCTDVVQVGNIADWSATNAVVDESKIPFMNRSPDGLIIADTIGRGGHGGIRVRTENGTAQHVIINGDMMIGSESTNSQFCNALAIGEDGTGYYLNHAVIANGVTRISRGNGGAEPAGRDIPISIASANNVIVSNRVWITDSAVGLALSNVTRAVISNCIDYVTGTHGPNTQPVINFSGSCSDITISNIIHSRADIGGKSALFGGLASVTDLTCNFTRTLKIITNGAGGYTLGDYWDMVNTVTLTTTYIDIAFKSHVTQYAADTSVVQINSASHTNAYKNQTTGKTLRIYVLDFANAVANPQTATFTVEATFGA